MTPWFDFPVICPSGSDTGPTAKARSPTDDGAALAVGSGPVVAH